MKLSVIIPYYKTLELTKKLLDTLVPQLTKECECILIDDGCNELELDKYPITVIHKENSGVSKARNDGIDKSTGEYIWMIDSDDMIKPYAIEKWLQKIEQEKSKFDFCLCSWEAVGRLKGQYIITDNAPSWNTSIWDCIYKREKIGRFDTTKTIAEDEDFNNKYRKGIKANIEEILYIYNSGRENSLTDRYSKGLIDRNLSIQSSLLLYQKSISEIGGVEKFISEFCEEFKDIYDITLVYTDCDDKQLKLLRKMVKCIKFGGQKFECDKYLCVSNQFNIADNVYSREGWYADMIHADYTAMGWAYKKHPKTNVHIAVSEVARQSFLKQRPDDNCKLIYNLLKIKEIKPILHLITCARMDSKEKGYDRMVTFANRLNDRNIPFIWQVFTERVKDAIKGVAYLPTILDIDSYIKDNDYYINLSDTESWGYSTAQALELGVPIICTNYPAIHEQGLVNGVNGYILSLDMSNLDEIIDKMIENRLSFKYEKKDNPKDWIKLLGNMPKPKEKGDNNYMYRVKAIRDFLDSTNGIQRSQNAIYEESGDNTWIVDEDRYFVLLDGNGVELVEVIEEKKENKKNNKKK